MSFSLSENWDSVTAPSVPAGWTVDAPFVTSTTYDHTAPNSLKVGTATSGTKYYATSTSSDADGGSQVDCTTLVYFESSVSSGDSANGGLTFRCSSSTMDNSSTSCYWAYISVNTSGTGNYLKFAKIVNGTVTDLASVQNLDSGLLKGQWYGIRVLSVGVNQFNVNLTRISDSYTMNSSGNFSAASASAISLTAADISSGAYYGVAGAANTVIGSASNKIYFDEVTVSASAYVMAIPPRKPCVVRLPFQYYHPD